MQVLTVGQAMPVILAMDVGNPMTAHRFPPSTVARERAVPPV
jgi:hypothetical protein